jgi:hypothetical protein
VVRVHFLLDGIVYHAVKHLACPTTAAYVGMQLPLPPGARSVVHDVYAEIGGYNGQRFPAAGYALDQPVQGNERPADAVAWSTVDLGAMCTLFLVSWWRDPTRGQRVALALSP